MTPARLFAVVALLVGVVLALAVPPMVGFDEEDHYLRTYQVAHGSLLAVERTGADGVRSTGGSVPRSLAALTATPTVLRAVRAPARFYDFGGFGGRISTARPGFVDFRNAAGEPALPYLPAAVVMRAGQAAGVSALGLLYLARLAQVVAFVVLLAAAAALYRPAAPVFLVVGLLPSAVAQAATVSADPVTIGVACLVIASVLAGLRSPRPLPETVGLAVALGLCKPIYVLLVLGYLLPGRPAPSGDPAVGPGGRAGGRAGWGRRLAPVAAGGVVAAGWAVLAQRSYLPLQPLFGAQGTVDTGRQTRLVEHHPGRFVGAAARTVTGQFGDLLRGVVAHLTRADYPAPLVLVVLLWLLLVAVPLTSPSLAAEPPTRAFRILAPAVTAVGCGGLLLALYLQVTEVGGGTVFGVQGRYLIPFLPALLAALPTVAPRVRWSPDRQALAVVGAAGGLLVASTAFALA